MGTTRETYSDYAKTVTSFIHLSCAVKWAWVSDEKLIHSNLFFCGLGELYTRLLLTFVELACALEVSWGMFTFC